MDEKVSGTTEPGQEYRNGHGIEQWEMPAMSVASAMTGSMAYMKMSVAWDVEMKVQRTANKRYGCKHKADDETYEIEKFPVHKLSLAYLRRAVWLRLRTQHVQ